MPASPLLGALRLLGTPSAVSLLLPMGVQGHFRTHLRKPQIAGPATWMTVMEVLPGACQGTFTLIQMILSEV